jgi:hypothetical protein
MRNESGLNVTYLVCRAVLPIFAVGLLVTVTGIANAYSGAIFTTNSGGVTVDQNLYSAKTEVYLNGGPQNTNSAGLPNGGTYYFQVTGPDGTLLSSDPAVCRQVTVANNVVSGAVAAPGCVAPYAPHPVGTYNSTNKSTPVQLAPFNDTGNPGGEYKVWLIAQTPNTKIDLDDNTVINFFPQDSKTDNFKVLAGTIPVEGISGLKFYDANLDGVKQANEPGIAGWQIELFRDALSNTTTFSTPTTGGYIFLNLPTGSYGVCEVMPKNAPMWVNTTPTTIPNIAVPPGTDSANFGNVCLGKAGGLTLGFWSNKNGQALVGSDDLVMLNLLNLRNANGSGFDPGTSTTSTTTYTAFRTWILSATAVNMAYMLSAQLAAMELNVFNGKVNGASMVYAGSAPDNCSVVGLSQSGFISISNLMNDANVSLGLYGLTLASGDIDIRNCQQFLKNALDYANNDRNFVQSAPCEVNYSGTERSCIPVE